MIPVAESKGSEHSVPVDALRPKTNEFAYSGLKLALYRVDVHVAFLKESRLQRGRQDETAIS